MFKWTEYCPIPGNQIQMFAFQSHNFLSHSNLTDKFHYQPVEHKKKNPETYIKRNGKRVKQEVVAFPVLMLTLKTQNTALIFHTDTG